MNALYYSCKGSVVHARGPAAAARSVRPVAALRCFRSSAPRGGRAAEAAGVATPVAQQQRQQQQHGGSSARRLVTAAAAAPGGVADAVSESESFAVAMAKVADDTKVQDLVVLNVGPLVSWTSYFVVCTVVSKPQLLAVMARIEKAAEEDWGRAKQNSPGSSPWEVLDFGDVVIHVFTPDQREHYDIESFYAAAEEVDLPFAAPDRQQGGAAAAPAGGWAKQL